MDYIYEKLIYKSDKEKEEMYMKCIQEVASSENMSLEEVKKALDYSELLESQCKDKLREYESDILFNLVRKNGADKLWSGKAWENKTCKRKCPFGEMCKKDLVCIDGKKMCYGQLLYNNFSENQIEALAAEGSDVKIIHSNGEVRIDLTKDYDDQRYDAFFSEYFFFILLNFGFEKRTRSGTHRICGQNVLLPLLRKMEQKENDEV